MIVFPNAKVNLGLFVTEKRPDGFHNLETVFYPIALTDVLEIVEMKRDSGFCEFHNTGIDVECEPEKNLIVKAYRMLDADFHLPAVDIYLHKVIPFGAGLGGGSSDAAFALKALNDLFSLYLSLVQLENYAARLGSDCAFFIQNKPAFASGKGEILESMDFSLKDYRFMLVKPSFGVSTPEAYRGIHPAPASFDLHHLGDIPVESWKTSVKNDFETNVFPLHPRLPELKAYLYAQGAAYVSMSGSGSAIFGLFPRDVAVNLDCPDCFIWQEE